MSISTASMIGRLKAIRKSLGLTQKEFAARVGLGYGVIRDNEQGIKAITDNTIKLICDRLGVNERWLRFGEGRMFVDTRLDGIDAKKDMFRQFALTFNLSVEQQRHVAEYVSFPLDAADIYSESKDTAKRNVARLLKAIDKGSVGRVVNTE